MKLYEIKVKDSYGKEVSLSEYDGKTLLIVNTATGCGFTPQYEGLQDLYEKYKDKGFEILDFPCNQFAEQAPGSAEEIGAFCKSRYGITFRQFEKVNVNGADESPVFTYLKSQKGGVGTKEIKWNFTKFLIDKNGNVIDRFAPATTPKAIEKKLVKVL
ncbi:MAG: glutathione peroxidase [Oscillospiraceae bacterium]|jgi:glutathione peroxidase|nr:glutathione peroxidase [Oscillospiraceae bacterium]